jgi:hypothetical protein
VLLENAGVFAVKYSRAMIKITTCRMAPVDVFVGLCPFTDFICDLSHIANR